MSRRPAAAPSVGERTWLHRLLERLLWWIDPEDHPQGVVYGIVVVGSVVAAESVHVTGPWQDIGGAVLVLVIYWLAHSYAQILGTRFADATSLTFKQMRAIVRHEGAILRGAALPIVAMMVAALLGAGALRVDEIGIGIDVLALMSFAILAGLRAKLGPLALISQSVVALVFGLMITVLRSLLA